MEVLTGLAVFVYGARTWQRWNKMTVREKWLRDSVADDHADNLRARNDQYTAGIDYDNKLAGRHVPGLRGGMKKAQPLTNEKVRVTFKERDARVAPGARYQMESSYDNAL